MSGSAEARDSGGRRVPRRHEYLAGDKACSSAPPRPTTERHGNCDWRSRLRDRGRESKFVSCDGGGGRIYAQCSKRNAWGTTRRASAYQFRWGSVAPTIGAQDDGNGLFRCETLGAAVDRTSTRLTSSH